MLIVFQLPNQIQRSSCSKLWCASSMQTCSVLREPGKMFSIPDTFLSPYESAARPNCQPVITYKAGWGLEM